MSKVGGIEPLPCGPTGKPATPLNAAATATAGAMTATLAAPTNNSLVYVSGFEITGAGATAASVIAATLATLLGGVTFTYDIAVPVGAAVGVPALIVEFVEPIPANILGGSIVLTVPSFGAGNTNAACNLHGFAVDMT